MQPLPPEPTLKNLFKLFFMPWRYPRLLNKIAGISSLVTVITSLASLILPGKIGDILIWIGVSALVPCTVLMTILWFREDRKLQAEMPAWRKEIDEDFRQRLKDIEDRR